ncbi:ABC transporter permease subunit [Clostridium sp.]|jgi:putative aldouronate transport system permease protein|uniref:ABC transporter permease n=1 Tax=Clostridium sp. TaxID=1506 RepID=UPI00258CE126|nr:ABC transporter permease subunit [Clostridium sp.]MDF2503146.1 ABC-type polysaccharide transport system, permease component [Clostridium sp.]
MKKRKDQLSYHLMLTPGMIFLILFSFIPMLGIIMAFQNYIPAKGILGSPWVGLENFKYMLEIPDSARILGNTLIIAIGKIVLGTIIPITFALLLNEIRLMWAKKTIQTIVYLPHFLSWAVLAAVVVNIFDLNGPINGFLGLFGIKSTMFLVSNHWFRPILIGTDVWKEFGYGSIVYLAALTGIDPGLYEAASIDGANRLKQLIHVTLPGIMPIIMLMIAMNLGNILNAGFDQVFNLYNPIVYQTGDIIDTYVYRVGLVGMQYSFATAVGLLKSVVGCILLLSANKLSKKLANMQIF